MDSQLVFGALRNSYAAGTLRWIEAFKRSRRLSLLNICLFYQQYYKDSALKVTVPLFWRGELRLIRTVGPGGSAYL
jgi:hypothetical protein